MLKRKGKIRPSEIKTTCYVKLESKNKKTWRNSQVVPELAPK